MEKEHRDLLERILWVQSDSGKTEAMVQLIASLALERGYAYREDQGNAYVTKSTDGDASLPIGLVAHTDTVHDIIGDDAYRLMTDGNNYFGWDSKKAKMTGVGGDDKCGIFLAFAVAEEIPNARLFFPRDEEIGCVGAALGELDFFDGCAFVMQGDRRGYGDITETIMSLDMMSEEFKDALKPHMEEWGMKFVSGAMTDVHELKDMGLNICAFNMSAGYYNAHSSSEVVNTEALEYTRLFMLDVIYGLGNRVWSHTAERKTYPVYRPKGETRDWGSIDRCAWCQETKKEQGATNAFRWKVGIGHLCPECTEFAEWRDEHPGEITGRLGAGGKLICDHCNAVTHILSFWGENNDMLCEACLATMNKDAREVVDSIVDAYVQCEFCGQGAADWIEEMEMWVCNHCMDLNSVRDMRDCG